MNVVYTGIDPALCPGNSLHVKLRFTGGLVVSYDPTRDSRIFRQHDRGLVSEGLVREHTGSFFGGKGLPHLVFA